MVFNITNSGSEKYTLTHMGGAFVTPSNSSHVTRQLKPFMYDVSVAPSATVTVPYHLHPVFESEEKFEMGLILVLYFTDASKNFYQSVAYDGIITIHEPELNIFDPQVYVPGESAGRLSIYAFCLAMVGGIIYWVKESYFAPVAGKKTKAGLLGSPARERAPVGK
ncbi:MAG: hypothetical protein BJ554DRAFT_2714 [Olpidium bornovanus]|uniref:Translocon-associated protein subunit alpha n=1 Tax=Olpidium bornovanus TaxID=278681 RepID=A0A8H8DGF1_9FUNG|nr:MAG: hypothetical protein BJ554DRAFT_2714 [Olpidium bornovanus]